MSYKSSLQSGSASVPVTLGEVISDVLHLQSVLVFGAHPMSTFFGSIVGSDRIPQLKVGSRRGSSFPIFSSWPMRGCTPNSLAVYSAVAHSTPLVVGMPISIVGKGSPGGASSRLLVASPMILSIVSDSVHTFDNTTGLRSQCVSSSTSCLNSRGSCPMGFDLVFPP